MSSSPIDDLMARLGRTSPSFQWSYHKLTAMLEQVRGLPMLQLRLKLWRAALAPRSVPADEGLFVAHTYLANLCRLVCYLHLRSGSAPTFETDLGEVLDGQYFRGQSIYGFPEEDLFTWPLWPPLREEAIELAAKLLGDLDCAPATTSPDLLAELYRDVGTPTDSEGPWSGIDINTRQVLGRHIAMRDGGLPSLLDPACGGGSRLAMAVMAARHELERQGVDPIDSLLYIQDSLVGVGRDPVAVAVARACYLLALGDLVHGPHPDLLLPIYIADCSQPLAFFQSGQGSGGGADDVYLVTPAGAGFGLELPGSLVNDPVQLDWVLHRLGQYLHAASIRVSSEGEDAIQQVLNALYNYLTAPKRAGQRRLPPLSPSAADVVCRATRALIYRMLPGEDLIWLDCLKNAAAPAFLAHRKFDYVLVSPSNSPGLSPDDDPLMQPYLKEGGAILVVAESSAP